MNANRFQAVVSGVLKPTLVSQGYKIELNPPGYDEKGSIWFEKQLQEGIFVLIDIQPSPWQLDDFTRFAVNLVRNDPGYQMYRDWQTIPGYFLGERLASALWIDDRHDPKWESDHWWNFQNEKTLEKACQDALEKLLKYGIPYLEDLSTKSLRIQG